MWTLALIAFTWLTPYTVIAAMTLAIWSRRGHPRKETTTNYIYIMKVLFLLVTAELCAFFCGRRYLEPWNYGNITTGCSNMSDIGAAKECKHDTDADREGSPVAPTALMAIVTTPFVVTSIFYALIWMKMKGSKRLLQSLEVAAFNKHIREVQIAKKGSPGW